MKSWAKILFSVLIISLFSFGCGGGGGGDDDNLGRCTTDCSKFGNTNISYYDDMTLEECQAKVNEKGCGGPYCPYDGSTCSDIVPN
jgi:hypothetical protein